MKNPIILIVVLLIATGIFSCTKKATVNAPVNPLQGKWSIKSDSITTGSGNSVTGVKYVGTASDYFDFRTSTRLYTKEGDKLDTFAYTLKSDSLMYYGAVGTDLYDAYPYNGHLRSLNSNRVTIYVTPVHFNPGGYYSRLIVLQR